MKKNSLELLRYNSTYSIFFEKKFKWFSNKLAKPELEDYKLYFTTN